MAQSGAAPSYLRNLDELQRKTFRFTLLFVVGATQLALLAGDVAVRPLSPSFIASGVNLMAFCGLCYWLFRQHPQAARYVFIIGLSVGNIIAYTIFVSPVFLYFFPFICLFASMLLPRLATIAFAFISSALVIGIAKHEGIATIFPVLFLIWFVLSTNFVAFHNLIEALRMAWDYERYAIAQMKEAREHRAQLMKLTKALEEAKQELAQANIQLHRAYSAAEEARRLKAMFAANVSHEFRTPINLIVGFSEMIVSAPKAYGERLPNAYWSDLQTICECAKHLQSLISDVLDISQVEAGYMAMVKELADPRLVILEAANLTRDLIQSAGLKFNVTVPDQLPSMWIDRTRIRQVLLNLLSNAVRFTAQGSISLRVTDHTTHIAIAVSDTGTGIRPEDIPHIFDAFYQAEETNYRRSQGSGLGLTLSKEFINLHGGAISVESNGKTGEGSTFTVTLPYENYALSRTNVRHERQATDKRDCFVILDDDPAIIRLFERYTVHHRLIAAQSVEEAIRLMEAIQPSAMVVSNEQDKNLLTAAAQRAGQSPAVIVCPMPSGRRAMQIYGATDYLVKPVTQQALHSAIQRINIVPYNVLVIDDDQDIVRMFGRMIQTLPGVQEVWKAYSGREGLALMRYQRPDLVILDVLMPDVDGLTTLQMMQNDPTLCDIPVIIASASGATEAIAPVAKGTLSVESINGFQPLELVHCVESLLDALTPTIAAERAESRPG